MTTINEILNQAFSAHQAGHLDHAEAGYRTVLQHAPATWSAMTLLATIALQRGQWQQAIAGFQKSLALHVAQPDAYLNLGNAFREIGQPEQALACYEQSLTLQPHFVAAWVNRGNVLRELRRFDAAIDNYQSALALAPDSGDIHNNLGIAYWESGRFEMALQAYESALQYSPNDAGIWHNRGHTLRAIGRYNEALGSDQRALALQPDYLEAILGCGDTLCVMRQFDAALRCYDQAIELRADYADAWWAKALTQLQLGNFVSGWQCYEWRWQLPNRQAEHQRYARLTQWTGREDVRDKHVLLHAEQGFGDAIQFCRYALKLQEMGAKITLEVRQPLVALLQSLSPTINVVAQPTELNGKYDFHCPLMSLPLTLSTSLKTIPANTPYLHVETARQQQWQNRLGPASKPRIGLAWSGSATHKADHTRSIPLAQLQSLFNEQLEFHSLQTEIRDDDQKILSAGVPLHIHASQLENFSDTAALLSQMDLVISVDTSVAHLAGAMGKPVWVLLPYSADFRWLLDRTDSPWYPSMRLFRQTQPRDWGEILRQVVAELDGYF